jgi:dCMP deaminase
MSMAHLAARRSKDPSTQCGAVTVSVPEGRILGIGYNGFPNGCKDAFPWEREGDFLNTKYPYVVHAEGNAIANSNASLVGADIYCTLFPCHECAKTIHQNGIKRVIYWDDKYHDENWMIAARRIFHAAKIETINMKLQGSILEYR